MAKLYNKTSAVFMRITIFGRCIQQNSTIFTPYKTMNFSYVCIYEITFLRTLSFPVVTFYTINAHTKNSTNKKCFVWLSLKKKKKKIAFAHIYFHEAQLNVYNIVLVYVCLCMFEYVLFLYYIIQVQTFNRNAVRKVVRGQRKVKSQKYYLL